jgi:hypothetical protein
LPSRNRKTIRNQLVEQVYKVCFSSYWYFHYWMQSISLPKNQKSFGNGASNGSLHLSDAPGNIQDKPEIAHLE